MVFCVVLVVNVFELFFLVVFSNLSFSFCYLFSPFLTEMRIKEVKSGGGGRGGGGGEQDKIEEEAKKEKEEEEDEKYDEEEDEEENEEDEEEDEEDEEDEGEEDDEEEGALEMFRCVRERVTNVNKNFPEYSGFEVFFLSLFCFCFVFVFVFVFVFGLPCWL